MEINLPNAIEGFRIAFDEHWRYGWGNTETATNQCGTASYAFAMFLGSMGLDHEEVLMIQRLKIPDVYPDAVSESKSHVVVRHGDIYIDWTRRQYQPNADFPHICARFDLEAEGWSFLKGTVRSL